MDIERFEHTAAWLEYCDGMTRFHAETEAARRQGLKRWEVLNAIGKRNSEPERHPGAAAARQSAPDLPGMQPQPAKEEGPVYKRDVQAGRSGLEMLALRA